MRSPGWASQKAVQMFLEYPLKPGSWGHRQMQFHCGSLQIHGVSLQVPQTCSQAWSWRALVDLCTVCQLLCSGSGKCLATCSTVFLRTWCLPPAALPVWCQHLLGLLWRDFLYSTWGRCCYGRRSPLSFPCGEELGFAGRTELLPHRYAGCLSWSAKKFLKTPPEHVSIFLIVFFLRDEYSKS